MSGKAVFGEEPEEDEDVPQPAPVTKEKIVMGEEAEEDDDQEAMYGKDSKQDTTKPDDDKSSDTASEDDFAEGMNNFSISKDAPWKPQTALQKRVVDRNDAVRKGIAKKLIQAYTQTNKDLVQISIELSNTLTLTQEISNHFMDTNDNVTKLTEKMPGVISVLTNFVNGTSVQ